VPDQLDLFGGYGYPGSPGYKAPGPSQEAAEAMKDSARLRAMALRVLQGESLTADEVAARLRRSVLAIRPRVSELSAMGFIVDTGVRRKNSSGRRATVWRSLK
jgi:predicted ArsR family transcriptional regulator